MKKIKFLLVLVLTAFCLTGCSLPFNIDFSSKKNKEGSIESCPGCVFAFYTDYKYIASSSTASYMRAETTELTDYETDYRKVIEKTGKNFFLGHTLDKNGKINRSFVCAEIDDKPFCFEVYGESKMEASSQFLQKLIDDGISCSEWRSPIFGCSNGIYIEVYKTFAEIWDDTGSWCAVNTDGSSACYIRS